MQTTGHQYVTADNTPTTGQWSITDLFKATGWSSGITDINNTGPQSTDFPGGARFYPFADYPERAVIWKMHEYYIRGLFYLLQHENDSRIPALLRTDALLAGLVPGLFTEPHEDDTVGWMPQLYVRESRRIIGDYVMNESDLIAADGTPAPGPSGKVLSAGSYARDSHHIRRIASLISGQWATVNEGNLFLSDVTTNKIFPVPIEALTPKKSEVSNLGVIFAASTTHPCFGAFRMEMALMQAGEAMGETIAVCLEDGSAPAIQDVNYSTLRPRLIEDGIVAPLQN